MQIKNGERLYSASDVVAFLGCEHRTSLDLRRLEGWDVAPAAPDAASALVQAYGDRHELAYLDKLSASGRQVVEIDRRASLSERVAATRAAMAAGAEVIFQATFVSPPFVGHADFLLRVPGPSLLGDHHYEVADTKLARSNRAKFMVQLCFYADLLAEVQGRLPEHVQVVLGPRAGAGASRAEATMDNAAKLRTVDYIHHVRALKARFLEFVGSVPSTQPQPVPACVLCGWSEHCEAHWESVDHLSQVANIRAGQIAKLEAAGVATMQALSQNALPVKGIAPEVLDRLRRQADLQCRPFDADRRRRIEFRTAGPDGKPRGFALLPQPDPGDLYFDMEGFPHEPGGLEYLFGVGWFEQGDRSRWVFRPFWAHDRAQEKLAFEQFMDFVERHLQQHPAAHIYHYGAYEKTAIQRLSGQHDTRVTLRDRLLREGRLVDLYSVVGGALLLALPSYSIKKVEAYYRGQRQGEVATAGESIVQYEAWRAATDEATRQRLLHDIERYNRDDVESTQQLHDWLEHIRPADAPRFIADAPGDSDPGELREHEQRVLTAKAALADWVTKQPTAQRDESARLAELLGQLLGFYRRCKLDYWRWFFELDGKMPDELEDDPKCLANLKIQGSGVRDKQSLRYTVTVPAQETKLSTGSTVRCLTDGLPAAGLHYDERAGTASFKRRATSPRPPEILTLCLTDEIKTDPKLDAIYRYVARLCAGEAGDDAVRRLLSRDMPALRGRVPGERVAADASAEEVTDAVQRLDSSHLVIQGPPGTGKTTTAAKVIAALLADGKTVGVMSNSHAAINNLVAAAYRRALDTGVRVTAGVAERQDDLPPEIAKIDRKNLDPAVTPLAGGTAWVFCREEQHQRWDYLFVDEASQVSLADIVAAGQCARNLVLLGDQMQLAQPIEGAHPGDSGQSVLDYLLQGHATVPPELGIFLGQTHRLHPDVCAPVSEGVYEGRLNSAPGCERQRLLLGAEADAALRPTGVVYVPVAHQNCRQRSDVEAERILALYHSLLRQRWVNRDGIEAALTAQDILVVAPYKAQVQLLRRTLGDDARVDTVDKFQGQEGAVAILSMTTSSGEDVPRGLGFLFSRNRLNVAISRAKCLALVVASPALRLLACSSVDDMPLLNFYARVTQAA